MRHSVQRARCPTDGMVLRDPKGGLLCTILFVGVSCSSARPANTRECGATSPPQAPGCQAAGGVCVASGSCSGTLASAYSKECVFADGLGDCCVPPPPSLSGDACSDIGGICASVAGCGLVNGWRMSTGDCPNVGIPCCVPQAICGDVNVICCGATWASAASCVRGTFVCQQPGHVLVCASDCVLP